MATPRSFRRFSSARRVALCCTTLIAGAWPLAAQAKASAPVAISVGEPEGFSNLTEEHVLMVDVFVGGVRKGEAKISAAPGEVRFLDPAAAMALLPPLTDRAAVEAALSASSLPANSQLACSETSDRSRCGRLEPDVVGLILNRDRFRVDIFVNPRFLAVEDELADAYLPKPQGGLAMINSIGGILSGSSASPTYYNFQDQFVAGSGERRLRADISYASNLDLGAQRLVFEWDRPGLRYSAGALWAPGNDIAGQRKLIGAGIESQIDTRLDKDAILGSPIVVFLDQRARVDVLRDGRVLNSAIYEAGNQQIDTSNLPEGSYDIVLRIDEPGRQAREEHRFFTKSRRIPSLGRTDFFAFGGLMVDGADSGSLEPSGHPYVEGGAIRRLSERWAVEGQVQATDGGASAELGATFILPAAQLHAAAVADLDGRYGAIFQVSSNGISRLSFNFDLRHIESREAPAGAFVLPPSAAPASPFAAPGLTRLGASYSQAGGIVSYSLANLRFLGVASYRDSKGQEASYSVGPSLQWDVLRKGPFTLTLRSDVAATERGTSGFAGVTLRLLGRRASVTALGGGRASGIRRDDAGDGAVASLAGTWSADAVGGDLALGAGYDHEPRRDDLILSSQFDHPLGSLSGDYVHSDAQGQALSQYSLGFQTTVTAGAGAVRVAGKTTTQSMVVARVDGARPQDRFEVLVNEQVAGTIVGNHPLTLALPTYRAYQLRIRPTGKDLLAYDSSPRNVGLYPGSVARLEWDAAPVTIKFGRLVGPDGHAIAHASITRQGVWAETDDDGFFQIEAPDDAEVTVTTHEGRSFATILPRGDRTGDIAQLGPVTCCEADPIRLGVLAAADLDAASLPDEKGSK
jgi:hypothetical protein